MIRGEFGNSSSSYWKLFELLKVWNWNIRVTGDIWVIESSTLYMIVKLKRLSGRYHVTSNIDCMRKWRFSHSSFWKWFNWYKYLLNVTVPSGVHLRTDEIFSIKKHMNSEHKFSLHKLDLFIIRHDIFC